MATGVFGVPVTKETLIATGMFTDPSKITQKDIGSYAETMMTADGRDRDALKYVENLKLEYGNGISTLFVFYNATGSPLTFTKSNDWHGHNYKIPPPSQLENGQWGAFLHVHTAGAAVGSAGAVVYRGNLNNDTRDWLLSWEVPWGASGNKVYTEIREKDHWPAKGTWDYVYNVKLVNSGTQSSDTQHGRRSDMLIGVDTSPIVRSVLKLV